MTRANLLITDPRRPEITVTKRDFGDIENLLSIHATHWSGRSVEYLVRELMRATIVDEGSIPADVVTMGSHVEYREEGKDSSQIVTLSYPGEREFLDDAISVLTPIGAALLGLAAGQSICYAGSDGNPVTITIIRVVHRPEASSRTQLKSAPRSASGHAASVHRIDGVVSRAKSSSAAVPARELPDRSGSGITSSGEETP
jgi:regulator of nucleoside diphosphate kinase